MTPYTHDMPGGTGWALTLPRHTELRLSCLGAGANASMLVFADRDRLERLNVPDTLKAQMSACVRAPMVLMSDLGSALLTVTGSTVDWHDAVCGHSLDADVRRRYGDSDYARDGNGWRRSARALLLDELATYGLGRRDLHATVNWFSKVVPDDRLTFVAGHARTGDQVALRAEQDVLVVLATAPHPLDPADRWQPAGVRAAVAPVPAPGADDPGRTFRRESGRALALAERSAP